MPVVLSVLHQYRNSTIESKFFQLFNSFETVRGSKIKRIMNTYNPKKIHMNRVGRMLIRWAEYKKLQVQFHKHIWTFQQIFSASSFQRTFSSSTHLNISSLKRIYNFRNSNWTFTQRNRTSNFFSSEWWQNSLSKMTFFNSKFLTVLSKSNTQDCANTNNTFPVSRRKICTFCIQRPHLRFLRQHLRQFN